LITMTDIERTKNPALPVPEAAATSLVAMALLAAGALVAVLLRRRRSRS
jgi:MYXO-CTERM domain-containing protein